ncbi:zinc finger protein OZF-like isoform X1, partial [Clarias magur]
NTVLHQETGLISRKPLDMEDVLSLNKNADEDLTKRLCCNGEDQHAEWTLLKTCTVRLVDFMKIQKISERNRHTGGECSMFGGDQKPLQAQLKIQRRKATAESQTEEGAYYQKYKPNSFSSS